MTMIMINRGGVNAMNRPVLFRQVGFTLIELVIVVLIVSVLALFAIPGYQNSVREGRRGDAKSDLVELSQAMERCYTTNSTYAPAAGCPGVSTAPGTIAAAASTSPQTGTPINYNISFPAGTNTKLAYILQAVPVNDQLKDYCGTLTIDNTGAKTPVNGTNGTNCW